MIKRRLIYRVFRDKYKGDLPRHARTAANILSRLSFQLDKQPIPYRLDYAFPHHIIIYINNNVISAYADGFTPLIELAPLDDNGKPLDRDETSFSTPKGVVNYILRKYSKPKS